MKFSLIVNKKSNFNFINGDKLIEKKNRFKITTYIKLFFYPIFFIIELFFDKKICQKEVFKIDYFKNFLKFYNYSEKDLTTKRPARILQEFKILNYLDNNFEKNQILKVLDIGCGDGRFLNILKNYFVEVKYIGIDKKIRSNLKNLENKNIKFIENDLNSNFLEDRKINFYPDLIFSQSCLEHIKNDLNVLKILNNLFPKSKNFHLVPGSISFLNYMAHGYRRYNLKMIKKIETLLNKKINFDKLGGKIALKAYFNYYNDFIIKQDANKIRHPLIFLKIEKENYNTELIKKFLFHDQKSYALFYVLDY